MAHLVAEPMLAASGEVTRQRQRRRRARMGGQVERRWPEKDSTNMYVLVYNNLMKGNGFAVRLDLFQCFSSIQLFVQIPISRSPPARVSDGWRCLREREKERPAGVRGECVRSRTYIGKVIQ